MSDTTSSARSEIATPATPTAAGPPRPMPNDVMAEKVPEPAREAVVITGHHRADQPPLSEKVAAAERDVVGVEPVGTIVEGIEDDTLWVMLRSFNNVSHTTGHATSTPLILSK